MSAPYSVPPRRDAVIRALRWIDDYMNWMLFGSETWLVALLKGVPYFLYLLFLVGHVPNFSYLLTTLYLFHFSKDVGYLVANIVGGTTLVLFIGLTLWTQAARGRRGFAWSLIRFLDFVQWLLVVLLIIPFMAFALAGGSLLPPSFPLGALGMTVVTGGMGVLSVGYLLWEYRRITLREAGAATTAVEALGG